VAQALALAEPPAARHQRPDEGSPADGPAIPYHRRTTTCNTAVSLLRDPLAMPLLPFMHNV
jgi:hypothetical protein